MSAQNSITVSPRLAGGCAAWSIAGTKGCKLRMELLRARSKKTAISYLPRFCWYGIPWSSVRKISNSAWAAVKSLPFFTPAHPICATVRHSWPINSGASSLGRFSSSRMRKGGLLRALFGLLQHGQALLTLHRRETVQKLVERVVLLQVVEQAPHRHARPHEHDRSTQDLGVRVVGLGFHVRIFAHFPQKASLRPGGKKGGQP